MDDVIVIITFVGFLLGLFAILMSLDGPLCKTKCNKCDFTTNKIKPGRCCPACNAGVMLDIDEY